jgi:hypothetical protein
MMIEFHFAQRNLRRKEKTSMFRLHFVATCFAIITLGTTAITAGTLASTRNGDVVEITDLQPFTHVAEIPVGLQTSSIRIEGIKLVKIATKRRTVTNEVSCNQPWAEPGGSMFCQRTKDESPVPAYRVTYSYRSQPMASDEYGNPHFTFNVYFRPDEISPRLRERVASGKIGRAELAEFFDITTSREPVQETVIDETRSSLCDGNYVDGNWIHTNPKCEDNIAYRRVAMPSSYIRVKVDPGTPRYETAAASALGRSEFQRKPGIRRCRASH